MSRFEELMDAVKNDKTMEPMIRDMVNLEKELDRLRELPKIIVDPEDARHQKVTKAGRMYKEYLQTYTNMVKVVLRVSGVDQTEEDSPLRKWMNSHVDQ